MPLLGSNLINPINLVMTITLNELTGQLSCVTNRPIPHLQAIGILSAIIEAQVTDAIRQATQGANQVLNPNKNPSANPPGGNSGN